MGINHKRKNEDPDNATIAKNADGTIFASSMTGASSTAYVRRSAKTTWDDIQLQLTNLGLLDTQTTTSISKTKDAAGEKFPFGNRKGHLDPEEPQWDETNDPFLSYLQTEILPLRTEMEEWTRKQTQTAETILSQLSNDLVEAEKQSALFNEQAKERKRLREEQEQQRSSLQKELQETDAAIRAMQEEIVLYQQDTKRALEECEAIELHRKRDEVKLRRRVALFAECTGIKWNYDADFETTVEALVKIPSKDEFCRLSLDATTLSRFEIANALWDTIEGRGTQKVVSSPPTFSPSWSPRG